MVHKEDYLRQLPMRTDKWGRRRISSFDSPADRGDRGTTPFAWRSHKLHRSLSAIVEFLICVDSSHFVGTHDSTFGQQVAANLRYYNQTQHTGQMVAYLYM